MKRRIQGIWWGAQLAFCAANVRDISRAALCISLLIVVPFCSPRTVRAMALWAGRAHGCARVHPGITSLPLSISRWKKDVGQGVIFDCMFSIKIFSFLLFLLLSSNKSPLSWTHTPSETPSSCCSRRACYSPQWHHKTPNLLWLWLPAQPAKKRNLLSLSSLEPVLPFWAGIMVQFRIHWIRLKLTQLKGR